MDREIWTRNFVLICISNFFIATSFQMLLPIFSLYITHLGGNDFLVGITAGGFMASSMFMRPWAGRWVNNHMRTVLMVGLTFYFFIVISYGFAGLVFVVILLRMMHGMAWGMYTTASSTLTTLIIPEHRRGEGFGYFGLFGNIAGAVGPFLSLTLITISFMTSFLTSAALVVLAFILIFFINPPKVPSLQRGNVRVPGQSRFIERTALFPALLNYFLTTTFGGMVTFLPLYALSRGVDNFQWYYVLYTGMLLLTRVFAGKLYDKRGHVWTLIPGISFVFLAMVLMNFISSLWMLLCVAILFGLGFGSAQPTLQAWAVKEAPPERKGLANATFMSSLDLGIGSGAVIFGLIAQFWGYTGLYSVAAINVGTALVCYLIYLRRQSVKKRLDPSASQSTHAG